MRRRRQKQSELDFLFEDLSLTAASREYPRLLSESEGIGHADFLRRVLECEQAARVERRREKTLKRAGLLGAKGLGELDFSRRKDLKPTLLAELGTCRFVEERRNVVLLGPAGTGKTTLAQALALAATMEGYSVHAVTGERMLDDMRIAQTDGSTRRISRRYLRPELLLVDDLWLLEAWQGPFLFRVIATRHRRASTLLRPLRRATEGRQGGSTLRSPPKRRRSAAKEGRGRLSASLGR